MLWDIKIFHFLNVNLLNITWYSYTQLSEIKDAIYLWAFFSLLPSSLYQYLLRGEMRIKLQLQHMMASSAWCGWLSVPEFTVFSTKLPAFGSGEHLFLRWSTGSWFHRCRWRFSIPVALIVFFQSFLGFLWSRFMPLDSFKFYSRSL